MVFFGDCRGGDDGMESNVCLLEVDERLDEEMLGKIADRFIEEGLAVMIIDGVISDGNIFLRLFLEFCLDMYKNSCGRGLVVLNNMDANSDEVLEQVLVCAEEVESVSFLMIVKDDRYKDKIKHLPFEGAGGNIF